MGGFFTRERFGRPQVLAGLLLLIFLGQCAWLVHRSAGLTPDEESRISEGMRRWNEARNPHAFLPPPENDKGREATETGVSDPNHSSLWYLVASAPLMLWPEGMRLHSNHSLVWLARAPYLLFGILLGASLWYVSRRLYGNAGGYVALGLYCFSPAIIRSSAVWFAEPEAGAAWGAFGTIFTAIAVAHTLYAPREVVLWNWRRIVLLGVSLALAVGSQFSLIVVIPIALAFMLYLAPTRRIAAAMIWTAACAISFLLLYASYLFQWKTFRAEMAQADFLALAWRSFAMAGAYRRVFAQLGQSNPALVVAIPVALMVYLLWPRTRYFGNTAPLFVAVILVLMGIATPHYPGLGFQLVALPFLLVFVAGISADLLETRYRNLVMACLWGLLIANAIWNLAELARA
jgi:hypothetical protein